MTARPKPSLFDRLTGRARDRDRMLPLYQALVAIGRDAAWYREGKVPDTLDGRFDMIAAVMALTLIRFEKELGEQAKRDSVLLTEIFIADMDETLRQIGIGDYVVGKHVGRLVGALGGRLTAFRAAVAEGDFAPVVHRNIFHDAEGREAEIGFVADRLRRFSDRLAGAPMSDLVAGRLPTA